MVEEELVADPVELVVGDPGRHVPADLGESLREIADPELREVLEAVARGIGAKAGADGIEMTAIPIMGKLKG